MSAAYGGYGPNLLAAGWTLAGAATILMVMRLYAFIRVTRFAGWAAMWTTIAFILTMAAQCAATVAIVNGVGNHAEVVYPTGQLPTALMWLMVYFPLFYVGVAIGKVAVCSFLMASQPSMEWYWRGLLHFLAIGSVILSIINTFFVIFTCDPVRAFYDFELFVHHEATCYPNRLDAGAIAIGVWFAITDLVYALYPIRIVWPLSLPMKIKLMICVLLGLGVFTAVAAGVRTDLLYNGPNVFNRSDQTYYIREGFLWGALEMWFVLIIANIPPLYPLFKPAIRTAISFASRPAQAVFSSKGGVFQGTRRAKRAAYAARLESYQVDDVDGMHGRPEDGIRMVQSVNVKYSYMNPDNSYAIPELDEQERTERLNSGKDSSFDRDRLWRSV